MVVKSIFRNVEYPKDRKSIEHIIKEYDKVLEYKLHGFSRTEKPGYVIQILGIALVVYIFECSWISLWIRLLYIIPLIVSVTYNIFSFIKVKSSNHNEEKKNYKFNNSSVILLISFIHGGIFGYETVLFRKDYKDYLIYFIILVFFSLLNLIKYRREAPQKFIRQYLYTDNKIYKYNTIIIALVQLLVSIAYFEKPYFLLLIVSSIFLVIFLGMMSYAFFEYQQYDKIQDLKKEINYMPKKKK